MGHDVTSLFRGAAFGRLMSSTLVQRIMLPVLGLVTALAWGFMPSPASAAPSNVALLTERITLSPANDAGVATVRVTLLNLGTDDVTVSVDQTEDPVSCELAVTAGQVVPRRGPAT